MAGMIKLYATERTGGIFWNEDLSGYTEYPIKPGNELVLGEFPSRDAAEKFWKFNVRHHAYMNERYVETADLGAGI